MFLNISKNPFFNCPNFPTLLFLLLDGQWVCLRHIFGVILDLEGNFQSFSLWALLERSFVKLYILGLRDLVLWAARQIINLFGLLKQRMILAKVLGLDELYRTVRFKFKWGLTCGWFGDLELVRLLLVLAFNRFFIEMRCEGLGLGGHCLRVVVVWVFELEFIVLHLSLELSFIHFNYYLVMN